MTDQLAAIHAHETTAPDSPAPERRSIEQNISMSLAARSTAAAAVHRKSASRPIIGNAFPRERRRRRNDQNVQFRCVTSAEV
jgi:hypothetical protein